MPTRSRAAWCPRWRRAWTRCRGREPGTHPQRQRGARDAARGLHRRGRRHDDRRRSGRRGEVAGSDGQRASRRPCAARRSVRHARRTPASPCCSSRGEGMRLYDDEGREYLDFVSGIGAVNLGHAHPAVAAAVGEQVAQAHPRLEPLLRRAPRRARLRLVGLLGGGHEGLLRATRAPRPTRAPSSSRAAGRARHKPGAYQRRDRAAVVPRPHARRARRHRPARQAGGVRARCRKASSTSPLNDVDALDDGARRDRSRAHARAGPRRGRRLARRRRVPAGGRALCRERAMLLIFDEVQSGFFRTGPAFAHQALRSDARTS